jgi:hypothetical protein
MVFEKCSIGGHPRVKKFISAMEMSGKFVEDTGNCGNFAREKHLSRLLAYSGDTFVRLVRYKLLLLSVGSSDGRGGGCCPG